MNVLVRGDGIAACCCAHLLRNSEFTITVQAGGRPRLPAILLTEATLALLRDVFELPDLFRDLPKVTRRVVLWGQQAEPIALEHSAVVVSEEVLIQSLQPHGNGPAEASAYEWEIFASKPLPPGTLQYAFGNRVARASRVLLKGESATCWIESLPGGWLFLVPTGEASGWLLSVGDASLAASRLIAKQIAQVQSVAGDFPAHPSIMLPLHGAGWMACGTAAVAFDPICGDGTANAVREAILVCAVLRALRDGGDCEALLQHYRNRVLAGFQKHLAISMGFYESGSSGPWWQSELLSLRRGLDWCAGQRAVSAHFQYRLNGFQLEALR